MEEFTFKAIGTEWRITSKEAPFRDEDQKEVLVFVNDFENRFSRFIDTSEVNAFRGAEAGTYPISEEFATLLAEADRLRELTGGVYDPAAGELLERAGYDKNYRMKPDDNTEGFVLPEWELEGKDLTINGPTAFDLGGIGKGYCIDRIANILISLGYHNIAVEAGGDMYVTEKPDGSAWKVAIQYPGKENIAVGTVELRNEALAVSDSFRRRWDNWHHIVDPHENKAIEHTIGAAAVAQNAWYADCMTSALFLAPRTTHPSIAQNYNAAYLTFGGNGECVASSNWNGEIFK